MDNAYYVKFTGRGVNKYINKKGELIAHKYFFKSQEEAKAALDLFRAKSLDIDAYDSYFSPKARTKWEIRKKKSSKQKRKK